MINVQLSPYLRDQRSFPLKDVKDLSNQVDQAYIDIASKVNARTIGLFANRYQVITGESWYLDGSSQKQQTLRQVYTFTSTTAIDHGIPVAQISGFTKMYGTYTDGTNWYGLIAGSNVAIAGQISFYITPTQIVFVVGGGSPTLTKGTIVLEWLSVF